MLLHPPRLSTPICSYGVGTPMPTISNATFDEMQQVRFQPWEGGGNHQISIWDVGRAH